jgi:outer membrane lipoprotein-sorting protein
MRRMSTNLILLVILIGTAVSGWVTAFQSRRRAGRALRRKVKDAELTSINTWMKVEEEEKRRPFGE